MKIQEYVRMLISRDIESKREAGKPENSINCLDFQPVCSSFNMFVLKFAVNLKDFWQDFFFFNMLLSCFNPTCAQSDFLKSKIIKWKECQGMWEDMGIMNFKLRKSNLVRVDFTHNVIQYIILSFTRFIS